MKDNLNINKTLKLYQNMGVKNIKMFEFKTDFYRVENN